MAKSPDSRGVKEPAKEKAKQKIAAPKPVPPPKPHLDFLNKGGHASKFNAPKGRIFRHQGR